MALFRRLVGLIILLISLSAMAVAVAGIYYGRQAVDQFVPSVSGSTSQVDELLELVVETLDFAKLSLNDVSDGLDTVVVSIDNASGAIRDTEPLLNDIEQIAANDVPDSLQALEETLPTLVDVAENVDTALTQLGDLDIDLEIPEFEIPSIPLVGYDGFDFPGVDIEFQGADYQPDVPLSVAVDSIGQSLDGVPENLRSLSTGIDTTTDNLVVISDDISQISTDLGVVNQRLREIPPFLDQYVAQIESIDSTIGGATSSIGQQTANIKLGLTVLLTWFALIQLAPLVVGWWLLTGRRVRPRYEAESTA